MLSQPLANSPWWTHLGLMLLSSLVAYLLAKVLLPLAHRTGWLDRPDGQHKRHRQPTAYLGGLVLWSCISLTCSLMSPPLPAWWLALSAMMMLGLWDDKRPLGPGQKLLGQLLLIGLGLALLCYPPGAHPMMFAPLSWRWLGAGAWLLLCCNAVNLLDVADGLALSTSWMAFILLWICAQSTPGGVGLPAHWLAISAGACMGLYPFNAPPAQMFLGDAGSLFLGCWLGWATLPYILQLPFHQGALVAADVLIVPLLEVGVLIVARCQQGRAPWLPSPDHIALRLRHAGWQPMAINAWAVLYAILGGLLALLAWGPLILGPPYGPYVQLGLQGAFVLLILGTLRLLLKLPPPKLTCNPQSSTLQNPTLVAQAPCQLLSHH